MKASCRHNGYTLVELIVVLLIIGITISVVIPQVSLRSSEGDINHHSNHIIRMIQALQDESTLRGRILSLSIDSDAVRALQLRNGAWEPVKHASLVSHLVTAPFSLTLTRHQSPFNSGEEDSKHILFLPDGQTSDFEVVLSDGDSDERITIQQDHNGLRILEP